MSNIIVLIHSNTRIFIYILFSAFFSQAVYDRLMAQLALCEFDAIKTERISKMIDDELKNYKTIAETINQSIDMTKEDIESSKKELIIAKQVRKNRMEYDQLARVIKQQPDRKETQKQIESLDHDLAELREKKLKLQRKFHKRQKDFAVLMYAIRELECQLTEDSDGEECEPMDDDQHEPTKNKSQTNEPTLELKQQLLQANLENGVPKSNTIMMESLSDEDIDIGSPLPSLNAASVTPSSHRSGRHRDSLLKEAVSEYQQREDEDLKHGREPMVIEEDVILELSIEKDD